MTEVFSPSCSPYLDESLAKLMEILRLQINTMLHSSSSVQKRSCLFKAMVKGELGSLEKCGGGGYASGIKALF